jgi:hypothetical protein
MQTYQDVIETVEYEWREIGHEYGGRTLDAETTARRIWRYLAIDGTLKQLKAEERQWRREETTHLTVLDWFSSFEPTTIERES